MNLSETNVLRLLEPEIQFVLPIYQRHYSWEKEQCGQLWEDIVRMKRNPNVAGDNHFIGSIVNIYDNDTMSKFTLIDGQQRMTTLTLILIVLRDYARNHPDSGIDAREIERDYLKNSNHAYTKIEDEYKLILTGSDKSILIDLVDGNAEDYLQPTQAVTDEDETSVPRLIANYKFFKEKLESTKPDLTPQQVYEALGKLKIVNITLGDDDNPQAIFESLNSSGKDLSKSDLIRNFVLMGREPATMTQIYNRYWSRMERLFGTSENNTLLMDDFFRDYLTMARSQIPNEDRIYEVFKSWFYAASQNNPIRVICRELYERAEDYTKMKFAQHMNPQIQSVYAEIKNLKMEVSYPFLLKIHWDFSRNLITEEQLIQIMYMCISYVVRRDFCGLSSSSLNHIFVQLKRNLSIEQTHREIRGEDYVNFVKQEFADLQGSQRFPDNNEFLKAFTSYKLFNKQRCKYVLGLLENFGNENPINPKNFKVERIMPNPLLPVWRTELGAKADKIHERYVDTVVNLTLVEPGLEIKNNAFVYKKNSLLPSKLKLNAEIRELNSWSETTIVERKNILSERALKLWSDKGREGLVMINYSPLRVPEIAEHLDMRIRELAAEGEIDYSDAPEQGGYAGKQYQIDNKNIAAVVEKLLQVNIYPNININEVNDVIVQLQNRDQSAGAYVRTLGNGNIKIVLLGIRVDRANPEIPENCATDYDVDLVMEIIRRAYRRQVEE